MSSNKELTKSMFERFNALDAEGLAPLVSETVKHSAPGTQFGVDLEGSTAFIAYFKEKVFPKFEKVHFMPDNLFEDSEAGVVVTEWHGDFITKAGKPFSSKGVFVVTIADGKIDWVREYFDTEKTKKAMSQGG